MFSFLSFRSIAIIYSDRHVRSSDEQQNGQEGGSSVDTEKCPSTNHKSFVLSFMGADTANLNSACSQDTEEDDGVSQLRSLTQSDVSQRGSFLSASSSSITSESPSSSNQLDRSVSASSAPSVHIPSTSMTSRALLRTYSGAGVHIPRIGTPPSCASTSSSRPLILESSQFMGPSAATQNEELAYGPPRVFARTCSPSSSRAAPTSTTATSQDIGRSARRIFSRVVSAFAPSGYYLSQQEKRNLEKKNLAATISSAPVISRILADKSMRIAEAAYDRQLNIECPPCSSCRATAMFVEVCMYLSIYLSIYIYLCIYASLHLNCLLNIKYIY
jgi:hypothetical protein